MKQYESGVNGETIAEHYLCHKGLQCIARRFRAADGEIDLIMTEGEHIVFVEVKARPKGQAGSGLMAVTPAKQRRMYHAAMCFLLEREWLDKPFRFDVVEITIDGILHVPNAFVVCE